MLVIFGLNLLESHNPPKALELLAKDQDGLLRILKDCEEDPFKTLPGPQLSADTKSELRKISLLRNLLHVSEGKVDFRPQALESESNFSNNLNPYGSLVGVNGTNSFGNFDPKEMDDALLKSPMFRSDSDTHSLDTVDWSGFCIVLRNFIPIGHPQGHLVCYAKGRA